MGGRRGNSFPLTFNQSKPRRTEKSLLCQESYHSLPKSSASTLFLLQQGSITHSPCQRGASQLLQLASFQLQAPEALPAMRSHCRELPPSMHPQARNHHARCSTTWRQEDFCSRRQRKADTQWLAGVCFTDITAPEATEWSCKYPQNYIIKLFLIQECFIVEGKE